MLDVFSPTLTLSFSFILFMASTFVNVSAFWLKLDGVVIKNVYWGTLCIRWIPLHVSFIYIKCIYWLRFFFFYYLFCFCFFTLVNGKDVVTLVCFYLMLHCVVNMLNQKEKTPLFGMVFDGGLFCNSAE